MKLRLKVSKPNFKEHSLDTTSTAFAFMAVLGFYIVLTCPPNLGPGDMLEFDLDERRRNGQETLHSRTNHRHPSGG